MSRLNETARKLARRILRRNLAATKPSRRTSPADEAAAEERAARAAFLRDAFFVLAFNGIGGDYAEFGCWTGTTFRLAWHESRRAASVIGLWDRQPPHERRLWAFDSFAGLPSPRNPADVHPRWEPGTLRIGLDEFHTLLAAEGIPRSAYEVVPGFYENTLVAPTPVPALPEDICLAYVDCDLYSSTVTVLHFLSSRLKHGMILALDDYYCYSSDRPSGERQALADAFPFENGWNLVPYRPFGWHGMSFIVEVTTGRGAIGHERTRAGP
jgi:O-methyltransferase